MPREGRSHELRSAAAIGRKSDASASPKVSTTPWYDNHTPAFAL